MLSFLYSLQHFGIKMGLDNIRALCAEVDHPERRFASLHIAGTNGKGSTSACLASILRESGYRVGLYTSPHLVRFNERIRIDGMMIPDEDLDRWTRHFQSAIESLRATFFEATTAIAFSWFAEQSVDVVVAETGLGGRLDATNVLTPVASVITSIGLDHTEYLGSSLESIAEEKAGIIKQGVPVFTSVDQPEAMEVIAQRAREMLSPLHRGCQPLSAPSIRDVDVMEWTVLLGEMELPVRFPLIGEHQTRNAGLALSVAEHLRMSGWRVSHESMQKGAEKVRTNTGLTGRLSRISGPPDFIADVGHNAAGIRASLDAYSAALETSRTHLVFGLLATKDAHAVIDVLVTRSWRSVTVVRARSSEARPAEALAHLLAARGVSASVQASVLEGLHHADSIRGEGEEILVLGSHYVLGDLLTDLGWNESTPDLG